MNELLEDLKERVKVRTTLVEFVSRDVPEATGYSHISSNSWVGKILSAVQGFVEDEIDYKVAVCMLAYHEAREEAILLKVMEEVAASE